VQREGRGGGRKKKGKKGGEAAPSAQGVFYLREMKFARHKLNWPTTCEGKKGKRKEGKKKGGEKGGIIGEIVLAKSFVHSICILAKKKKKRKGGGERNRLRPSVTNEHGTTWPNSPLVNLGAPR